MKTLFFLITGLIGSLSWAQTQKYQLVYSFKNVKYETPTIAASSFDQAIEKGSQSCIHHMFSKFRMSQLTPDEKHMLATACANPRRI